MYEYLPGTNVDLDPLSEALESLGLQSWVPGPFELTSPWGLRVDSELGWCFRVVEGGLVATMDSDAPLRLQAGDLVGALPGRHLVLQDSLESRVDELGGMLWPRHFEQREPLVCGGHGALTRLAVVCFRFQRAVPEALLDSVPALLVRGRGGSSPVYVDYIYRLIERECHAGESCAQAVLDQLVRILLIRAVHDGTRVDPTGQPGRLAAWLDPEIGRAMSLIHQRPDEPWTVASLADAVAMSRSSFSARFAAVLGRPPVEYLTEWRMKRAAMLLSTGQAGLKEIANQVGYESAPAFSKAFSRWAGVSPTGFRTRIRRTSTLA